MLSSSWRLSGYYLCTSLKSTLRIAFSHLLLLVVRILPIFLFPDPVIILVVLNNPDGFTHARRAL